MASRFRRIVRSIAVRIIPNFVEGLELRDYVRKWVIPRRLETGVPRSHLPTELLEEESVEMNFDLQRERLARWTAHAALFRRLREDPRINTWNLGEDHLHNGWYGTPDAEVYAAMILDQKPDLIVEVGAGFSTLIAAATIREMTEPCRIAIIDPQPRTSVEAVAGEVHLLPVEDVPLPKFPMTKNTLLFIDSSHIIRAGGDIPYLYNRLLPTLPPGTLVHVDDVFLPFDYPSIYRKRLYTEQYILHALLSNARNLRVQFATHAMARRFPDLMRDVISPIVGQDERYYGSSLWFSVGQKGD